LLFILIVLLPHNLFVTLLGLLLAKLSLLRLLALELLLMLFVHLIEALLGLFVLLLFRFRPLAPVDRFGGFLVVVVDHFALDLPLNNHTVVLVEKHRPPRLGRAGLHSVLSGLLPRSTLIGLFDDDRRNDLVVLRRQNFDFNYLHSAYSYIKITSARAWVKIPSATKLLFSVWVFFLFISI
jgi:hypothetical protein